jgi:tetratricopeptide (TPR) repeat protein
MRFRPVLLALAIAAPLAVGPAGAQVPDEFTNLKVLPKDIGKQELLDIMKGFTAALGVRCSACHVQEVPGDFSTFDWASDEKDEKDIARGMMRMVKDLNAKTLPQITGENDSAVSCVTCHKGLAHPRTLAADLIGVAEKDGAEAAVARYRDLRKEYYGSGSFDFRPTSLDEVTRTLAEKGDTAGARRMAELNLELDPDHVIARLQLAQIELGDGNTDAARALVEKVLEQDPENRAAQRMQQQLKK